MIWCLDRDRSNHLWVFTEVCAFLARQNETSAPKCQRNAADHIVPDQPTVARLTHSTQPPSLNIKGDPGRDCLSRSCKDSAMIDYVSGAGKCFFHDPNHAQCSQGLVSSGFLVIHFTRHCCVPVSTHASRLCRQYWM